MWLLRDFSGGRGQVVGGREIPHQIWQLLAFLLFLVYTVSGLAIRQVQRGSTDCPHLSHRSGCGGDGGGSPKATLRFDRLRTDLKAEGCSASRYGS